MSVARSEVPRGIAFADRRPEGQPRAAHSDLEAVTVLVAAHELRTIEILADHAGLSDIARERIDIAAAAIRAGLNARCAQLQLPARGAEVAR